MSLLDLLGGPPYQDWIVLAGQRSPGLAVVRGCDCPRNWDIRQGYGFTGATVVFTGAGLAKFDVDIFAFESGHFADWRTFAKKCLMAPAGVRLSSMSIAHPQLNDAPLTITQVVVTNVSQWEQSGSDDGLWCRTISFLQYRAPIPLLVKPYQGPPGNPLAITPPVDPEVMQIKANADQIANLNK